MSLNLGGGSTTSNYIIKPQVFDTCLKSDEQHEVAGQKKLIKEDYSYVINNKY